MSAWLIQIIESIFTWIWETIVYCGQVIWDFFFHEESGLVWSFVGFVGDLAGWFLEQLPDISGILDDYSSSFSVTMSLVSKCDNFFPLTESIVLFGIFIVFLLVFLGAKLILKLIPTVG